jgi:hypothetical protein
MAPVPHGLLEGTFAYSIQGLMRAQNLGNQKYIAPASAPINVGLGGAGFFPNPDWPNLPPWGELPVMTAFYPTQYPPPPPPATTNGPSAPPAGPPYSPNVGYYPYTEVGVMVFDKGAVSGVMRVNTAGLANGQAGHFTGSYGFDAVPPGAGLPIGMITIHLEPPFQNHYWDYAFAMVSKGSVLLVTGGRLPRPAMGSGTLTKIEPDLLTGSDSTLV